MINNTTHTERGIHIERNIEYILKELGPIELETTTKVITYIHTYIHIVRYICI